MPSGTQPMMDARRIEPFHIVEIAEPDGREPSQQHTLIAAMRDVTGIGQCCCRGGGTAGDL
jgi:hypothetical protein